MSRARLCAPMIAASQVMKSDNAAAAMPSVKLAQVVGPKPGGDDRLDQHPALADAALVQPVADCLLETASLQRARRPLGAAAPWSPSLDAASHAPAPRQGLASMP